MGEQYFTQDPSVESNRQKIQLSLRGKELKFYTDNGVFSKNMIDYGSKLLIEHMEIPSSGKILDVGCGYGPIGLCAASIEKSCNVTMIDVNERAIGLAKENAVLNHISNVEIYRSDIYNRLEAGQKYDVILTNPPIRAGKEVVHSIFSGAVERLNDGGLLWVVIQKKQGAPSAFEKLESLFSTVEEVSKKKGYKIFKAINV
ncbi:class I SAM-dependent methyltransferase [Chengkuizengella axinellae]|uniref:Class I SAM-dependent methyltransferase n=1 Tax=Chengkuizengella axinellae TaxID=3064388 RepID=A0ABT9J5Z7_9BACL|nr:class I SAM-dependent methyltransferase [Chengkuizengella sp. 2205SS18-9]MDP5276872.1 class I SAM-dependent methyltransferase [Chengkuizengella sp. 2205SS18-9]